MNTRDLAFPLTQNLRNSLAKWQFYYITEVSACLIMEHESPIEFTGKNKLKQSFQLLFSLEFLLKHIIWFIYARINLCRLQQLKLFVIEKNRSRIKDLRYLMIMQNTSVHT